jgi:TonB family protein
VLAFAIVVPMVVEVHKSLDHITLVAPIPEYKPKPPVVHLIAPKIIPPLVIPTPVKTFVPPAVVVQVVKPRPVVEAPEIKPVPPQPELKVELPPAPKAPIKVGSFQPTTELAKAAPPTPQQKVQVGGFGDPHGVPPSDNARPSAATLSKVGAFDMPDGAGHSGRGGNSQTGAEIRQTGFGTSGDQGRPKPVATAQVVHPTAFGDATLTPPPAAKKVENIADNQTPVQILSKPKPVYTPEARELRLEGEVSLQVVFQADGTIHVVRVVRGLGHGLDEAAVQAATRVRFKPATRGGVAIDTNATIKISFELT